MNSSIYATSLTYNSSDFIIYQHFSCIQYNLAKPIKIRVSKSTPAFSRGSLAFMVALKFAKASSIGLRSGLYAGRTEQGCLGLPLYSQIPST